MPIRAKIPIYFDVGEKDNMRETNPNQFVHTADLHLAPRSATIVKRDPYTNRLIRDLDMSSAFERAVDDTLAQNPLPSAFIIAGDIFDTNQGSQDAIIDAATQIQRLRDAGIEVVGIAGNHDTPTQRKKTPAYQVLWHEFADIARDPGVHLSYDTIEKVVVGNIEYVLVPHLVLMTGGMTREDLAPEHGVEYSVLVVHGIAAGDQTFSQVDEMKEASVAPWIMDMPWDYIAFGHYHKPGWIPGYEGKAAYCGSLENTVISGPDVCHRRGPVYVDMSASGNDKFKMHPQPIRRIVQLPDIDLADSDVNAEELDTMITELILDADVNDAIVLNTVRNIPRSVIKTMNRRSFQAVNPEMLFIKTKLEAAKELPAAIQMNRHDDDESSGEDLEGKSSEDAFKPLAAEVREALDMLCNAGEIRESRKEAISDIITALL